MIGVPRGDALERGATVDRLLTVAIRVAAVLLVLALAGLAARWYLQRDVQDHLAVIDRDAKTLEDQVRQSPNDPALRVAIANLFVERGQYDEALSQARQVLTVDKSNEGALLAQGEAYRRKGDLGRAEGAFSGIVEANVSNPTARSDLKLAIAYQSLGDIHLAQGRADAAEDEFRRSLEIDRGNADALRLLGNAQAAQGKQAEAVESYRQAVRLVPEFREAYSDLVEAYRIMGDADRLAYADGMVALVDGQYAAAEESLSRAVKALPRAADVHLGLAMAYEKDGQKTLALEEYRASAQIDGTSIAAKQGLGRLEAR